MRTLTNYGAIWDKKGVEIDKIYIGKRCHIGQKRCENSIIRCKIGQKIGVRLGRNESRKKVQNWTKKVLDWVKIGARLGSKYSRKMVPIWTKKL